MPESAITFNVNANGNDANEHNYDANEHNYDADIINDPLQNFDMSHIITEMRNHQEKSIEEYDR